MSVRITRVSIQRGGPLREDFQLEPAGLNLIYGYNETGKTYIVEAMISLLFRTGRDTPWITRGTSTLRATVRDWDPRGEIEVAGLEDEPTVFSPGSPRLEEHARAHEGLPEDLSRLMVVRSGDTRLSDSRDGVGDEVLRTYLSGNRVLDEVEANIDQATVKNATIKDGSIEARNQGLFKNKLLLDKKISYLDDLRMKVNERASLASLSALMKKREAMREELREMEDAKRHRAFELFQERSRLEGEQEELPSEKELMDLSTDISMYRARNGDLERIREKLERLEPVDGNIRWLEAAREEYLTGDRKSGSSGGAVAACRYLAPLLMVLSAAGAFFSTVLAVAAAAGAVGCLAFQRFRDRAGLSPEAMERRRSIEDEFESRFGRQLKDPATLQVVHQELERDHVRHQSNLESSEALQKEVHDLMRRIISEFYRITGEEPRVEEWDGLLEELRSERKRVQESIVSLNGFLASLNVEPESFIPDPPGCEWDQKTYNDLRDDLAALEERLSGERRMLEELKSDITMATRERSGDIRQLITALEERITEAEDERREVVARLLAENSVYRAVCQYREQENSRLEEALGSQEIVNPLYQITGRYTGVRMTPEGGLRIRASGQGEYPLSQLSNGAREQVYITLRTGIASLAFGEPAFLLLDDAFQHSDWLRRKRLVEHVIGLVRDGWQVFYFTMDDHLRKLLDGSGRELGSGVYRYASLN